MYRVNIPIEIFNIPGFPYPTHLPSFPHHSDVLKYLQDYASYYQLNQHIKCGVVVEHVTPIPKDKADDGKSLSEGKSGQFQDSIKWRVTATLVGSGKRTSEDYDAVLVCTGYVIWYGGGGGV